MQITVGTSDGETFQLELADGSQLVGKEIGDEIEGELVGLEGYTLRITGGTDRQGFPMRHSLEGSQRRRVMLEDGQGIGETEDGVRRRKSVRGRQVSEEIQQLNTVVVEEGEKTVEELLDQGQE